MAKQTTADKLDALLSAVSGIAERVSALEEAPPKGSSLSTAPKAKSKTPKIPTKDRLIWCQHRGTLLLGIRYVDTRGGIKVKGISPRIWAEVLPHAAAIKAALQEAPDDTKGLPALSDLSPMPWARD